MVSLQREITDNQHFCGLLNFRGKIVPVFDLVKSEERHILDINAFLVVTHSDGRDAALIAIEVNGIVDIEDTAISTITPIDQPAFHVAKLGNDMVRLASPQEFIA
jgi:chemotaxis signal transduction protein